MNTIRKTIKWVFVLLVVGAATAGGYAFYYWNHSDEWLRQTMLERLHEIAPDWDVRFPRAWFDSQGRIHLSDLSLKGVDGGPLLDVAEVILVVDREKLMEPHPPMRLVRWIRPKVHLARDAEGVWNFQKLTPPTLPRNVIPEIHLERMTVALAFQDSTAGQTVPTTIENIHVDLIPSGARQWLVKATGKFPFCDTVSAEGNWQIDAGRWDLHGQVSNLACGPGLSQLAAELSPEYRSGLAQLDAFLSRLGAGAAPAGVEPRAPATITPPVASAAGRPATAPGGGPPDAIARLGLSAEADVQFRVSQWRPGAEREYKLTARILEGELKNPPAPFPLRDIRGEIELDNRQIIFTRLAAQSGQMRINIERGQIVDRGELRPAEFDLTVKGLSLDERVRSLLKGSIARVYDDLQLSGDANLHTALKFDGRDRWEHDCDLAITNCTAAHRKFPYRIEQVEGTITQRGALVDVMMQGRAGTERVFLKGEIKNPGPEAECLIVIKFAGIPIDDQLRSASPRFQAVIDQLQAHGELAGQVKLERPSGLNQELAIVVDGRLKKGSASPRPFPFPLSELTGDFHCSGNHWTFERFQGRHGTAQVDLSGEYGADPRAEPELRLDFALTRAAFDQQLFTALPEELQAVRNEFNPEGGFEIDGRIFWSPGRPVRPAWLNARLFDARLMLKSFPFLVTDVTAEIKYDGELITIMSFSGRHDETTIQVKEGYARYNSDGEWRVRLEEMFVDDLEATLSFRRALPDKLLKIVDALDPRGKQSISGMLEFRGKRGGGYPVTAAWDTTTVYTGTTINAGVALRDMHGQAKFSGTWDGEEAIGAGHLDLKSVRIFDYQLTDIKGPARMNGSRLVLGSPPAPGRRERDAADSSERLSASFIDGRLALDADVKLGETMRYQVWTTLENGDLKRFAQLYMPTYKSLDGKMNGSVDLKGEGTNPKLLTGAGKLVIRPAALYDFPVIVKIFNALSFVPPDKKVFDTALFVFDIGGGVAHFEHIDLLGDAMTLIGRGTVDFNGKVHLGFGSRLGRKQLPIPIFRDLVNEVSKGWVVVDVSGTLREPKTEIKSFQEIDHALRKLLTIFDPHGPARR